jgi:hypothetical protein
MNEVLKGLDKDSQAYYIGETADYRGGYSRNNQTTRGCGEQGQQEGQSNNHSR